MTKILIIGFVHSGTSMLLELLKAHPQVGWIEFEESIIEFNKPKEWVLMIARKKVPDLKKYAWGEKIPWSIRDEDKNGVRPIQMSKKWLRYFKKDGRVLHILRHPIDVALSGNHGTYIDEKTWNYIVGSVPKVIDHINSNKRCATIVYEDLVTDPQTHLVNIFKFLNLKADKKIVNKVMNAPLKFGKINSSRAFAYRQKDVKINIDYDEFLKKMEHRL